VRALSASTETQPKIIIILFGLIKQEKHSTHPSFIIHCTLGEQTKHDSTVSLWVKWFLSGYAKSDANSRVDKRLALISTDWDPTQSGKMEVECSTRQREGIRCSVWMKKSKTGEIHTLYRVTSRTKTKTSWWKCWSFRASNGEPAVPASHLAWKDGSEAIHQTKPRFPRWKVEALSNQTHCRRLDGMPCNHDFEVRCQYGDEGFLELKERLISQNLSYHQGACSNSMQQWGKWEWIVMYAYMQPGIPGIYHRISCLLDWISVKSCTSIYKGDPVGGNNNHKIRCKHPIHQNCLSGKPKSTKLYVSWRKGLNSITRAVGICCVYRLSIGLCFVYDWSCL